MLLLINCFCVWLFLVLKIFNVCEMSMSEMKPRHLLAAELNYELRIRGVESNRDVNDKRKILSRLLARDRNGNRECKLEDPKYDFETERAAIVNTLDSIKAAVQEFEGPATDSAYARLQSRLIHVTERVKRIVVPDQDGEDVALFKNESYASCLTFEAELDERVAIEQNPANVSITAPIVNSTTGTVRVQESTKPANIYKWDVKFDGTSKTLGVKAFLERVKELAQARQVSKKQLYDSAADLIDGNARLWLRRVKENGSVTDWDSLVSKLERDFLVDDYDEELWQFIKTRKQKHDESVVIYVSVMESLFDRLSSPAAVSTKIKWIVRNLKSEYVKLLALEKLDNIEDLIKAARRLEVVLFEQLNETSNFRKSRLGMFESVTPNSSPRSFSNSTVHSRSRDEESRPPYQQYNSGLRCRNSLNNHRTDHSCRSFNNDHRSFVNNVNVEEELIPVHSRRREGTANEGNMTSVMCWNCKKRGHTYQDCRQRRSKFCYRCGLPNVTVASCKRCSGNA